MKKTVTVAMASFPPRRAGMLRVVSEIFPQCDRLCLYLNGYDRLPPQLRPLVKTGRLIVALAGAKSKNPDKGSQGKHHWLDEFGDGYYLTVDDDILYPPDYVGEMVAAIDRYSRRAIVTAHGTSYRLDADGRIPNFGNDRQHKIYYGYAKGFAEDRYVHCCGNACTGCCPSEIGMTGAVTVGPLHSGDDGDYALFAQARKIPIVRMRTPARWLLPDEDMWPVEAQHKNPERVRLQNEKARSWTLPWTLFPGEIAPGAAAAGPDTDDEAAVLTVSLTTYNTPHELLRQAVDSVLGQTMRKLRLIVINDAGSRDCWDALSDIADPRLTRIDMPENRGTYACHAETLRRCSTPYWSPCDSDDYCEADRYANMLAVAEEEDDVVLGGYTNIGVDGRRTEVVPYSSPRTARVSPHLRYLSVWAGGLWRTDWLRKAGGINGNFRVGYDSALQTIALTFSRVRTLADIGYIRVNRRDSLTQDPSTGFSSPYRLAVCRSLDALFDRALAAATLEEAGEIMATGYPEP